MKRLLLTTLLLLATSQAWGATYYTREDGGDTTECNGTTDTPWDNVDNNIVTNCAYRHPFYPIGWYTSETSGGQAGVMVGGDDLIVKQGTYTMGYSPSVTFGCSSGSGSFGCVTRAIPSGTSGNHTTIKGCSATGCGTGTKPKLTATGRATWLFNMDGKSWIDLDSLDMTDGATCGYNHSLLGCGSQDGAELSGRDGLRIISASNISVNNSWIHGFYRYGLYGGGVSNLTVTDTKIDFNSFGGWNADSCSSATTCQESGTISFTGTTPVTSSSAAMSISWNGCVENGSSPFTAANNGCYTQGTGGYGDGIGTAPTAGTWTFTQADVSHNTSDGIDLLYMNKSGISGGTVTVKRSRMEGNTGNQVKGPNSMTLEDNMIIGNCGFFDNKSYEISSSFTNCRASGNTVVIAWRNNSSTEPSIINNTITSNGTALILIEGPDTAACPSTVDINAYNNIFLGGRRYSSTSQSTELYYNSAFGDRGTNCQPELLLSNNACTGDFGHSNCTGTDAAGAYLQTAVTGNQYNATATTIFTGTISQGPTTFYTGTDYIDQLKIKNTGVAYNIADEGASGADAVDFNNFNRGAAWDSGGYEYGTIGQGGGAADCPAETRANCDLDATASGASDGTCSSGYTGTCSYSCLDGAWTLSSNTCVVQLCGNAQIDSLEECDGALLNGGTCASEGYSSCAGTIACTNCVLTQGTCAAYAIGNNCLDPGEQCEDGNTTNKDGCSSLGETENPLYQHFVADYTETDTPTTMSVRTHTVQMSGITHSADSSLKKDFTAGYFGDFVHRFKVQIDSCQDDGAGEDGGAMLWALATASYGDASEMETADDGIALQLQCFSSVARNTWKLIEYE